MTDTPEQEKTRAALAAALHHAAECARRHADASLDASNAEADPEKRASLATDGIVASRDAEHLSNLAYSYGIPAPPTRTAEDERADVLSSLAADMEHHRRNGAADLVGILRLIRNRFARGEHEGASTR